MNREVINGILNEVEEMRARFASGQMTHEVYVKTNTLLDERLRVYGLALASVSVVPPF